MLSGDPLPTSLGDERGGDRFVQLRREGDQARQEKGEKGRAGQETVDH
jgi:hypothetical protein